VVRAEEKNNRGGYQSRLLILKVGYKREKTVLNPELGPTVIRIQTHNKSEGGGGGVLRRIIVYV